MNNITVKCQRPVKTVLLFKFQNSDFKICYYVFKKSGVTHSCSSVEIELFLTFNLFSCGVIYLVFLHACQLQTMISVLQIITNTIIFNYQSVAILLIPDPTNQPHLCTYPTQYIVVQYNPVHTHPYTPPPPTHTHIPVVSLSSFC